MAVKGTDAAEYLLTQIGKPYSEQDCINAVVVNPIRKLPGGKKDYRIAGCTALWDSYEASSKYRDVTERITIADAECNGFYIGDILAIYDKKKHVCEHVGFYMGGIGGYSVIHSSASKGCVCGTTVHNGWTHVLRHRYIKGEVLTNVPDEEEKEEDTVSTIRKMQVKLDSGRLNLRNDPSASGRIIGHIPNGAVVEVLVDGEWPLVRYNGQSGYVSGKYLAAAEDESVSDELPDESGDRSKWGVFIPCESHEHAEMLAGFFNYRVVCRMEVND